MTKRLWLGYILVAAIVVGIYFQLPRQSLANPVVYNGVGLTAVLAVFVGCRLHRPTNLRAWIYLGAGLGSFLVADILFYVLERIHTSAPFPSAADALYLATYPLLILALRQLTVTVDGDWGWSSSIDAAIAAVIATAIFGVLVIGRYLADDSLSPLAQLISVAYPILDIILVAFATRLIVDAKLRRPSLVLLMIGLFSLLIADLCYGILNSAGLFSSGDVADAFWLGFYVCLGAAALHPNMAKPLVARDETLGATPRGVALLAFASLPVPIVGLIWGRPEDQPLTTACSTLLYILVTVRLGRVVGAVRAREAQAQYAARHDPLTGIGNRRMFTESVRTFAQAHPTDYLAVVYVDIDGFKEINDTCGHEVGDQLLIEVAQRLQNTVTTAGLVTRLGGDEFALLFHTPVEPVPDDVLHMVVAALIPEIMLGGVTVHTAASLGFAHQPCTPPPAPEELLRRADEAMYATKIERRRNRPPQQRTSPDPLRSAASSAADPL